MAVRVACPACCAAVMVYNARYLVVLHCSSCGCEFMLDEEILAAGQVVVPTTEKLERPCPAPKVPTRQSLPMQEPMVLTFCPMCGELSCEHLPECPACGEPLPIDEAENEYQRTPAKDEHFRRQARRLGMLWFFLAFFLNQYDIWIDEFRLTLPEMLSGGTMMFPPIPILTCLLVFLGIFALVGQFWAVAVAGLLHYVLILIVLWHADVPCLIVLLISTIGTHLTLMQVMANKTRQTTKPNY